MRYGAPARHRSRAEHVCVDGVTVSLVLRQTGEQFDGKIPDRKRKRAMPRNGILANHRGAQSVISGAVLNRGMTEVLRAGIGKTCTLPHTVATVCVDAFKGAQTSSVRLNEGLRVLERHCFASSGIRRLVLSSSVESIEKCAFCGCEHLECADLSAARGLKCIGAGAFSKCRELRRALLNEGLETIGNGCFEFSGLEEATIPGSVRDIGRKAFCFTHLSRAHFLGAPVRDPSGRSGES